LRADRHRLRTGRRDDLGHVQVLGLGEGPFEIGDRPFGAFDGRSGAVVADSAHTDTAVELSSGTETPCACRSGIEILLEIIRGPGLVAAEHDTNRLSWQLDTQVQ